MIRSPKKQTLTQLPLRLGVFLLLSLLSSPAWAATGGGNQMGSGVVSMFDEVKDFLTGPIVTSVATIAFIIALAGAYFGGGSDSLKKGLIVVAVTAGIVSAPGIVARIVQAAGGAIL